MPESQHMEVRPQPQQEDTSAHDAHNQEMINKADVGTGNEVNTGEKLYAGKYRSEEELQKAALELLSKREGGLEGAYKELEQGFHSQTNHQASQDTQDASQAGAENDASQDTQTEDAGKASLDFAKFTSEYTTDGKLADASVNELKAAGIPQEAIDQYLNGLNAMVTLNEQQAMAITGGPENYKSMVQWARANLSLADRNAFNEAVSDHLNFEERNNAIKNLFSKYSEANPQLLDGSGGVGGSHADVYESMAQLTADMNDPRYQKDPSFQKYVMTKLSRSKIM